jgi:competence protein ComFC
MLRSWAFSEGEIRQAIHRLKYRGDILLGEVFAHYLVRCFLQLGWQIDLVVPVPLALDRLAERGYNQASLLAKPFALQLNLMYAPGGLSRTRETHSQVGLTAKERRNNVFGAFTAREKLVKAKRILLVDDVTTTGSTLDACASTLLDAGAADVFGLTLLRATHRTELQSF